MIKIILILFGLYLVNKLFKFFRVVKVVQKQYTQKEEEYGFKNHTFVQKEKIIPKNEGEYVEFKEVKTEKLN